MYEPFWWKQLKICMGQIRYIIAQDLALCNEHRFTRSSVIQMILGSVMNAKHIEGVLELSVPISRSRITWQIASTCYTQNPGCSDSIQSIPLVKEWESQNVDGYLEIKGPSFYMLSIHMCGCILGLALSSNMSSCCMDWDRGSHLCYPPYPWWSWHHIESDTVTQWFRWHRGHHPWAVYYTTRCPVILPYVPQVLSFLQATDTSQVWLKYSYVFSLTNHFHVLQLQECFHS